MKGRIIQNDPLEPPVAEKPTKPVLQQTINTIATVATTAAFSTLIEKIFSKKIKQPIYVDRLNYVYALGYRALTGANKTAIYTNKDTVSHLMTKDKKIDLEAELTEVSLTVSNMLITTAIVAPTSFLATFYPGVMSNLSLQNNPVFTELRQYKFHQRVGIVFGLGFNNRSLGGPIRFAKEMAGVSAFVLTDWTSNQLSSILPNMLAMPASIGFAATLSGTVDTGLNKINYRFLKEVSLKGPRQLSVPNLWGVTQKLVNEEGWLKLFTHQSSSHVLGNACIYAIVYAVPHLLAPLFSDKTSPKVSSQPSKRGMFAPKVVEKLEIPVSAKPVCGDTSPKPKRGPGQ